MDAILAQASSQPPLSSTTRTSKAAHVFICVLLKTTLAPPQSCLLVTQSLLLLLSHLGSCPPPKPSLHPRGLALLLTGVICASRIDVVCWPIKIFEGNVYFLERIAAAAWKRF